MAFEDLQEKLVEQWQATSSRFLESSTGSQLAERYGNLPPTGQKAVIAGGLALVILIFLSIPWGWYSSSSDKVGLFEDNRRLIKDLFETQRNSGEVTGEARTLSQDSLISSIQGQLPTLRIPPDQIKSVQPYDNKASGRAIPGIPANLGQQGAEVRIGKLNLTQIVDVAHMLIATAPTAKLVGMDIQAASDDPRYFDVVYKIVAFSVPEPAAKAPPGSKRKSGPAARGGGDED
ncbi:MAG: hypothetical protein NDI61_02170 [Bdellovibrionaceae bacterium]|nr:hypothetical protein [Pseudobdellovibrionaceae bacterium]